MIHPTAVVHKGAQIDKDVEIGPYSVIGEKVTIGAGTRIGPHVVIEGRTTIGNHNTIMQFASIGAIPQHMRYRGEDTRLEIGSQNTIREFVTIHIGTAEDQGITRIGNRNMFMAYCHVAHDCVIQDSVIMANGATLAGHVVVEHHAILGGLVGVHQFVRIGQYAIVGGLSGVSLDIPPFMSAAGFRTKLYGLNLIGLKRNNFSPETIQRLKKAYRIIFKSSLLLEDAIEKVEGDMGEDPHVQRLVTFIKSSTRGMCR
jgi:UDP-N-acetylglucosamine acyltransferase